jgi:rhamnogalacturonan endolyase
MLPYLNDKTKWPGSKDVDHWDAQPDPRQFMLFAAIAGNNREWFELWKKLNLKNGSEAGRLSQAVKNPLLWIGTSSNVFPGNKSETSHSADTPSANSRSSLVLYTDNFNSGPSGWMAEFEKPENSRVTVADGMMDIISASGATIWFNHQLRGNIEITYSIKVVDAGGKYDRVSDLNAFWMASDPANQNLFTRDGKFTSYDNLELYYAGVGGNNNSTTRFRKYHSDGEKPVLKEYTDKEHLLTGNKSYEVKIICSNGQVQYYRDNVLYFDFLDKTPYRQGYFGIRTTRSHLQVRQFKVSQLQ